VEALSVEWNHWTQWFEQGLTQDEKIYEGPCISETESSSSAHGSYAQGGTNASYDYESSTKTNSAGVKITCGTGTTNCTPKGC
jgi:hypothetical protein